MGPSLVRYLGARERYHKLLNPNFTELLIVTSVSVHALAEPTYRPFPNVAQPLIHPRGRRPRPSAHRSAWAGSVREPACPQSHNQGRAPRPGLDSPAPEEAGGSPRPRPPQCHGRCGAPARKTAAGGVPRQGQARPPTQKATANPPHAAAHHETPHQTQAHPPTQKATANPPHAAARDGAPGRRQTDARRLGLARRASPGSPSAPPMRPNQLPPPQAVIRMPGGTVTRKRQGATSVKVPRSAPSRDANPHREVPATPAPAPTTAAA
jgi:hypothetical protein